MASTLLGLIPLGVAFFGLWVASDRCLVEMKEGRLGRAYRWLAIMAVCLAVSFYLGLGLV